MEPKTIREGGNNTTMVHFVGPVSYGQLTLKRGTYRVRARWAGAGDLAGAISKTLVLRVT